MLWLQALLILCLAPGTEADDSGRNEAVRLARETLKAHLGVPDGRIHLLAAEPARWSDSSLGCPEKGKSYQPQLTSGYGVSLRVDDRTFDVRVAEGRAVVCQAARATPDGQSDAAAATRLYRAARRDLATRLKLEESEVRVASVRPRIWRDRSLGCTSAPEASAPAPPEGIQGFAIELVARAKTYVYHSDLAQPVLCQAPAE
jgi:hypothetical protein